MRDGERGGGGSGASGGRSGDRASGTAARRQGDGRAASGRSAGRRGGGGGGGGGAGRAGRAAGSRSRPGYRRGGQAASGGWIFGGVVGAIALLVVIRLLTGLHPAKTHPVPAQDNQPVAAAIARDITSVPPSAFDAAGIKGAPLPYGAEAKVWRAADGKPVVLYVGAEYCPYCAASRWAMAAAFSRFGSLSGLRYMNSSYTDQYPGTPTITFVAARYRSPYIDLQTVEETTNVLDPSTGRYPTLQKPNAQQNALLTKLDATPYVPTSLAGGIPFVDVANRYIWTFSLVDPANLQGLTWSGVAQAVHSGYGNVGQSILAASNVLSAAICAVDGGRPASVCRSAPVAAAAKRLPGPYAGKSPVGGGTA